MSISLLLSDEAATRALGAAIARDVVPGMVVTLQGDLGAGKTTLVRGLLAELGHVGRVKSPTFTVVEPYMLSRLDCYHFDLYRLSESGAWRSSGFRDYFTERSLCLIEWPERAAGELPQANLAITLTVCDQGRRASLDATTKLGERCLLELEQQPLPPGVERADSSPPA